MSEPADSSEKEGLESRNAGRGGVFVLGAKVFFILIGFVQQALLQRVLGLSEYGALARVLAPANMVDNPRFGLEGMTRRSGLF